jgi:PAS domain S-box-containing protein
MSSRLDRGTFERNAAQRVFPGDDEMSGLCRGFDWAATPLGPVESWPQSLRTAAGMVIAHGFPSIVLWGPQLIQIYNDGFIAVHGAKHPRALGLPTRHVWPEVWHQNGPLFARALAGESLTLKAAPYLLARRGPKLPPDRVHVDLSFSPIRDETGSVGGVLVTLIDVTAEVENQHLQAEQQRLLAAALLSEERYELLSRATNDVIWDWNLATGEVLWNAALETTFGHRAEDVPTTVEFWQDHLHPEDRAATVNGIHAAMESGRQTWSAEYRFRRSDGAWATVLDRGLIARDDAGAVTRMIGSMLDITERERLLESERAARAEAEAANQAKADFLAAMSHELRTPLNAIGGYVDLLDLGVHGPLTEAQRMALLRVNANQRHLLTLINDVLAFARLEAGHITFHLQALPARALLATVEPLVRPLAAARRIDFGIEECDPSIALLGDAERIRQILLNLVGNAIKFTPPGGTVRLGCEADGEHVRMRVHDDGPGIALDQQGRIFEAFTQVDRRLSRPQDGVGLGLAISRDLARGMDGELEVESTLGEGSVFTLCLGRAPAEDAELAG